MANSACIRCQNQTFEARETTVDGLDRKLLFVQCASCGTPVGTVESHALLRQHEHDARMKNLEQQLAALSSAVSHISRIIGSIANQRTI